MIVKRYWRKYHKGYGHTDYKGIFLLGFIPLYIEMIGGG